MPAVVLGGGSNVVIGDAGVRGLVLHMAQRGVQLRDTGQGPVHVIASAGEAWDGLVEMCCARELSGIECLSGIPGLVGATPIQNVGAYGQDVADTIAAVRVLDRAALTVHTLGPEQCGFGYRDSRFKREPERFVVLEVTFALQPGPLRECKYAELRNALGAETAQPSPARVREAVLALRRGKSMVLDPADENRRSAGSFFTNPVLDAAAAQRVIDTALAKGWVNAEAEVPRYPQPDGRIKFSAAWLMERAGIRKGERSGPFGISTRHALALVHHGGGTSAQLMTFARDLRERVRSAVGVELTPEPVCLGFDVAP